ncbi:MAG: hypothetical protein J5I93_02505 [Pirellulaceae bacterium]|nr:hypothetical protein [Pirellulaceae bacterium]
MRTIGLHWEQRFGCREILDEQALLTCMVYVDMNQIKAGMAATPEDSRTSAIAARLDAWRAPICSGGLLITQSVGEVAGGSATVDVAGEAEAALWDSPRVDSKLGQTCAPPVADVETSAELAVPLLSCSSTGTNEAAGSSQCDKTSDAIPPLHTALSDADTVSSDADAGSSSADAGPSNAPSHARYRRPFPDGKRRRRASDNPILDMPMSE